MHCTLKVALVALLSFLLSACDEQKRVFQESIGDWVCVQGGVDEEAQSKNALSSHGTFLRISNGEFSKFVINDAEKDYFSNPIVVQFDYDNFKFESHATISDENLVGANWNWNSLKQMAQEKSVRRHVFKNENDNLSITTFFSIDPNDDPIPSKIECKRASIAELISDVEASIEAAKNRATLETKIVNEVWFKLAATVRSDDDVCSKIRNNLIHTRDEPDFVKNANLRVAINQLSVMNCRLDDDKIQPGRLLSEIGIQPVLPADWVGRYDAAVRRSGLAPLKNESMSSRQSTIDREPTDVVASPQISRPTKSKELEVTVAPEIAVDAQQSPPPISVSPSATRQGNAMESVSEPAATLDCSAESPLPQTPEDRKLLANGNRHLTGRSLRVGARGDVYVVEAALGYDGMCRPSPYQIYVFNQGEEVGTLSPTAMTARTDGAIVSFSQIDPENLQIEVSRYEPSAPLCCPSSIERRVVPLRQFGIGRARAEALDTPKAEPVVGEELAASTTGPSFDCAKASNEVENAICSNPELRRLDGELGRTYGDLVRELDPDERTALRTEQREWIRERRQECGAAISCLRATFRTRLEVLKTWTRRPFP
jgi:uncharacterized protein YecT (DUF1311 family)